jgi:hypothetical protein
MDKMLNQNEIDEIIRAYFTLKAEYDEEKGRDAHDYPNEIKDNHAEVVRIMNKHKQYAVFFLTEEEQEE